MHTGDDQCRDIECAEFVPHVERHGLLAVHRVDPRVQGGAHRLRVLLLGPVVGEVCREDLPQGGGVRLVVLGGQRSLERVRDLAGRDMAGWIAPEDAGLAALSTLVGALLLARVTAGSPLSEEILRAARKAAARLTD
ncbi:hypothetical protein AAH991_27435 [Microbispora sp. ZYX-F-249]|uniref:TetR family transcriptional regulator n=1 Tax=Microbispora maris TaxID=3144104 RepID=A0ABV0AUF5_9ACTN